MYLDHFKLNEPPFSLTPSTQFDCDLPDLNEKLQRISALSCDLKSLNKNELDQYLSHRLVKAGHTSGTLFSSGAKKRLLRACGGSPRLLHTLAHKALLVSYGRGMTQVNTESMNRAIADTESVLTTRHFNAPNIILALTTCFCAILIVIVYKRYGVF